MSSKQQEKEIINELIDNSDWDKLRQRFCTDIEKYVGVVKKEGFLRASKYDYNIAKPMAVLCCLMNVDVFDDLKEVEKKANNCPLKCRDYFTSCLKLYSIVPEIKECFEGLKKRDKKYDYASLVFVNTSFAKPNMKTDSLADALSCAIACSQSFDIENFCMHREKINTVFDKAIKIIEYRNLEVLIDCFDVYVEETEFDKKRKLRHFDLKDEKNYLYSIKWGWKRAFLQQISQETDSMNFRKIAESIEDVLNKFIDDYELSKLVKLDGNFFVLDGKWSSKKSIRAAVTKLRLIISRQGIYGDEIFLSKVIGTELLLPIEYYEKNFIRKTYSIWNVLCFRRLIVLFYILIRRSKPSIQSNYFCLKLNKRKLLCFLQTIVKNKTDQVLNDCVQNGYTGFVDLRYSSIIQFKESYVIPTEIMVKNNLIRNIMNKLGERARVDGAGEVDLIHERYVESLKKMNIPYCGHISYSESDLDTVFEIDHVIFISENKNMLFPASFHEARNIVYHYEKAKSQRDTFMKLFEKQDEKLFEILDGLKEKGIDFRNAKEIVFYLTFGNRNVCQLSTLDFPVTYMNQIIAFIENKPIKIHRLGKDGDFVIGEKKWRDDAKLTAEQMKKYLEWNKNLPDIARVPMSKKIGKNIFSYQDAGIVISNKSYIE